ncbi:MAG: single-stranded DNA-binding protein [Chloroflexi bacterium RBG_13_51_18]|nr:MAG: single-stranded DNA-binding protein [Chloroflexi bacterium RBG_13_51_18]
MQKVITDDMDALLNIFPPHIKTPLLKQTDISELLEVVIDLGREPEARFPKREVVLDKKEIDTSDIEYVVTRIGEFGEDNRAGIERTLHRISAIRNRRGDVVGLTCRVGRAVFGTIKIIEDLVKTGKSVLLLGRPGVGKTTMLREVARVLASEANKRVIIVDTSNEIAGDGDIPHPAIGHARRMQVATPKLQHAVMIEAVENHMPEVIVIDEIGTELEAMAARTIAERGVQLVGTAHGNTLGNLMMNPTLTDLIGGIQSVTLGDEEARRRGTQKSILERKSPPTFDIVVEIQERDRVAIHPDVGEAVDVLLRGIPPGTETRWLDEQGEVRIEKLKAEKAVSVKNKKIARENKAIKLFLFGVNKSRVLQIGHEMNIDLDIANSLKDATMLVTSKNYYRRRPQKVRDAESEHIPVYVLRGNTPPQIRQFLSTMNSAGDQGKTRDVQSAVVEAEEAVEQVNEGGEAIELSPQGAYIRRLQHLVAQRNDLKSHSTGRDPNRRVRIFKERMR